jgi:hypothetical protein
MKNKNCNWCSALFDYDTTKKPYCETCKQHMLKECIRCHRPMTLERYFTLNDTRCNACHKKYLKEKMKKNNYEIQSI